MADGTKSLGEKLFDSLVVARAETTTWAALSDHDRAICERAALDFCARLSPVAAPAATPPVLEAVDVKPALDVFWSRMLDVDDRNSPEEYPEMILVTYEEIERGMVEAVEAYRASTPPDVAQLVEALRTIADWFRWSDDRPLSDDAKAMRHIARQALSHYQRESGR